MAKLVPFSYSFPSPKGQHTFRVGTSRHSLLKSLTIYIEDDGLGPILVNAHVLIEGKKLHQLGQPTAIYDGSGFNAKRFSWVGELPLSLNLPNVIVVQHSNNSGVDINCVRLSGVVKR